MLRLLLTLMASLLVLAACESAPKTQSTVLTKIEPVYEEVEISTSTGRHGTLLFFINPNGRPCQAQDKILTDNRPEIRKYAEIQYVSTLNPDHRATYYQYGVRSLPSLILLDEKGNITKRYSPGIQYAINFLPDLEKL